MKLLLNTLFVVLFLVGGGAFADHKEGHAGHETECCDQKDCCKDCAHKDGKHSCCKSKSKAEECCKNCEDRKCKKACASGKCKKGHCDLKKKSDKEPAAKTTTES
jgi:hypothetical protein